MSSVFPKQTSASDMDRIDRIVVINDVAAAQGGATALAVESIRLFRGLGLEVTFLVGGDETNLEIEALGADVVKLGGRHIAKSGRLDSLTKGLYNRPLAKRLATWIDENDTPSTVYHLHGWSKILTPAVFPVLRPVAERLALHAHDFFLACPNGAFQDYQRDEACERVPLSLACLATNCDKRSYAQKLWRSARQEALFYASGKGFDATPILMIHEGMRPFMERAGYATHRLLTVRNPTRPFSRQRITAEHNRTFYFVGRLEREKGVFELAEAARAAAVCLKMAGDGPARQELEQRFPEIEIFGWIDRPSIGAMLRDARALVMPSLYREPFGLVALEASTSGLPVILSAHALLAEDIVEAGLGFVCDPTREGQLASLLRTVADLPSDRVERISRAAFEHPQRIASAPERWRDELLSVYRHMNAAPGRTLNGKSNA